MLRTPLSKKLKGLTEAKPSLSKSPSPPKNLNTARSSEYSTVLKDNNLKQSRIETLRIANEQAGKEHAIKVKILKLQAEQEIDNLHQ